MWDPRSQIDSYGIPTTLYRFSSYSDGAEPYNGLVEGNDNYFYGMTPIAEE